MKQRILLPTCLLFSVAALHATTLTDADLSGLTNLTRSYTGRVVCHDPSIFMDAVTNGTTSSPVYYIYGSHLGRGKTTAADNYQTWTSFGVGEESTGTTNSLFANTEGKLVNFADAYSTHAVTKVKDVNGNEITFGNFDAHQWQYSGNTITGNEWAPDVIYNPTMQKWLMYMSINGDNYCSTIVCMTSDNPEGPWVYQGPVVFSGFNGQYKHNGFVAANDYTHTDVPIALGLGTDDALPARYTDATKWTPYWPNCIDPCVFYDQAGNLKMSYGSWFGGIFLLDLDETTGLRDYTVKYTYTEAKTNDVQSCTCDPYFGYKIAGGYGVSGEASYIQYYNGYYYLFISNGGFSSNGGYQMRVYRATAPEGPYKDPYDLDACPGEALVNYGSGAKRDYGVKLFGGYQWETMPTGELAQGHNSVILDHNGHLLLVYHTRFNDGTEGHQVRVHELFQTADGWLVAAPYEYDGETVTCSTIKNTALFTTADIAGEYQLLVHPFRQNTAQKEIATPVNITLNADGTVTGTYTGSWSLTAGTSYINITLNNLFDAGYTTTFHGVLTEQTIDYTRVKALCFTACGTKKGETTQVSHGATVTTCGLCIWGSKADAKQAIAYNVIDLPSYTIKDLTLPTGSLGVTVTWSTSDANIITETGEIKGSGTATLTAIYSCGDYTYEKAYTVIADTNIPVYYPESTHTTFTGSNPSKESYVLSQNASCRFRFFEHATKNVNWGNWQLLVGNYYCVRNDNWEDKQGSNSHCVSNFNWDTFLADMDGSYVDMLCTYLSDGSFTMKATITTTDYKVYTYTYQNTIAEAPSTLTLSFASPYSYITPSYTGEYQPQSHHCSMAYGFNDNFSDDFRLADGETAHFQFYNYSTATENWYNWCLQGCDSHDGITLTGERFGIRADNWNNTTSNNEGFTSDFDWGTFKDDMNGSFVDMTCTLSQGTFTLTTKMTTVSGKTYHLSVNTTFVDKPLVIDLFFRSEKSFITPKQLTNKTYYPTAGLTDCSSGWWTSFSDTYTIQRGLSADFKFFNYNPGSGGKNYYNWVLVCTDGRDSHGSGGTEQLALRADNFGWSTAYNGNNLESNYNWDTFMSDLNGALIEMHIAYGNDNIVKMTSTATTTTGKVYTYNYTTPATVTSDTLGVFFSAEKAFIRPAYSTTIGQDGTVSTAYYNTIDDFTATSDNTLVFSVDPSRTDDNIFSLQDDGTWKASCLRLTDDKPFYTPRDITAATASYTRTMDNHWGTLCLPFAIDAVTADYCVYTLTNLTSESITLENNAEGSILAAGRPTFFKRVSDETEVTFSANNVTITADDAPTAGISPDNCTLHGTWTNPTVSVTEDANRYVLSADDELLYQLSSDIVFPPFRAWLETTTAVTNARLRVVNNATALFDIEDDETPLLYLDLNGRTTSASSTGLRIAGKEIQFVK